MKKAGLVIAHLVFALSLAAQVPTGGVQGRVLDKEGKPLAGVKVTLSRPLDADREAVTGPAGLFRFPGVPPAADYSLKAELAEFKTTVRSGLEVRLGGRVVADLVLEAGKPEEQSAATALGRMIDRTRFTTGASFDRLELEALPTARDPWVMAQLAPAVLIDRENVGGSESSEQARLVVRGDHTDGIDNTWSVDGIDVTDPIDLGLSDVAYDFETIEALSVTIGGARDVSGQTAGVALNIVTRRGGNKLGGTARFYLTDRAFQSNNMSSKAEYEGVPGVNRINQYKEYGAQVGGPLLKDHIWLWGAYGVQDLNGTTIYNTRDQALFSNYSLKLNIAPFAGNRFEALVAASQKERFGTNAAPAKPEGDHLFGRFGLGSPIFKVQDEQAFGPGLLIAARLAWTNTGQTTRPTVDQDLASPAVFDVAEGLYAPFSGLFGRSWDSSQIVRARKDAAVSVTLFRDEMLGLAHEIKGGLEFSRGKATSVSGFPQNYEIFRNFTDPLIDLGSGLVVPPAEWQRFVISREDRRVDLIKRSTAYLQDTVVKGRFVLQLGLRYDYQKPSGGATDIAAVLPTWSSVFGTDTMSALAERLPNLSVKAIDPRYQWSTWSPRIGLSWDLKGNGRTVLRLALSQYGDALAAGAHVPRPLGLTGNLGFWWKDADANSKVDPEEVFWQYSPVHAGTPNQLYALFDANGNLTDAAKAALEGGFESDAYLAGNFSGYDWNDPAAVNYDSLTTFFRSDVDPDAKNVKTSPRTREIVLGLEREIRPDLAASVTATFRRTDNYDWAKAFYPADIYPSTPDLVIDNTGDWYTVAGTIPNTVKIGTATIDMGDAAGKSWYLPVASFPGDTPYRMVDKSSMFRTYLGLDLAVTKRLANRWFLNASATLQDQRLHWGDSYIDPTNKWAFDGQPYGNVSEGAGGKVPVQMYARWMVKLSGLYQLPWGVNVSATFLAREGWKIPNYVVLAYAESSSWPGLYRANTVYLQPTTKDSLPSLKNLSLRVEKKFALGSGRMAVTAEVFNVLNSGTINRAFDAYYGVYYVDTEASAVNPLNRLPNEILNPRVLRLGLRFEF